MLSKALVRLLGVRGASAPWNEGCEKGTAAVEDPRAGLVAPRAPGGD